MRIQNYKLYTGFLIALLLIGTLTINGCVTVPSGTTNTTITKPKITEPKLPPENGEEGEDEEGMPSSDQASGTEPIPRYPGSIMIEYIPGVIGDIPSLAISYRTTDDYNTVLNWYRKQRTWQEAPAEFGEAIDLYSITDTEYLQVSLGSNGKLWRTSIGILYYTP